MIDEPQKLGKGRNNNLLGGAVICFMIGLPIMQVLVFLLSFMTLIPIDLTFVVVLLFIGCLPTIGGFYLMYKWYNSGY